MAHTITIEDNTKINFYAIFYCYEIQNKNVSTIYSNFETKGNFIDAWLSKTIKIGAADDADYPNRIDTQIPFDYCHSTNGCFTLLPNGRIQCNKSGNVIAFVQIIDSSELIGVNLIYKLSSQNAPYSHEKRFGYRPDTQQQRTITALNMFTVQTGTTISCTAAIHADGNVTIYGGVLETRILCVLV